MPHLVRIFKNKFRSKNKVAASCEGEGKKKSGIVALLWSDTLDLDTLSLPSNHIDVHVSQEGVAIRKLRGFYGFLE